MTRILLMLVVVCTVSFPAVAAAQGAIAGLVRDRAGAPLAAAVVEASSDVLIEGTRTTATDDAGRYRIEGLRPGNFTVQVSAVGFTTMVIEDIGVAGAGMTRLPVVMRPGQVSEVVTVLFENLPIDVTASTRALVLDRDLLAALPQGGSVNSLLAFVPGVTTDFNEAVIDPGYTPFTYRGGRPQEGRLLVDGTTVGSGAFGNTSAFYFTDPLHANQVVIAAPGVFGDVETGGLRINVIPNDGGNSHRAGIFGFGNSESMLGDNIGEDLRNLGIGNGIRLTDSWSLSAMASGPLRSRRLWYSLDGRVQHATREVPSLYFNQNAGDPTRFTYAPDTTRPVYSDRTWENAALRLTWLASARNRLSASFDGQAICRWCSGASTELGFPSTNSTPEALGVGDVEPQRLMQAGWLSPWSDRLMLEARASRFAFRWGNSQRDDVSTQLLTRVFDGTRFLRSQDCEANHSTTTTWDAAGTVFLGGHALTFAHAGTYFIDERLFESNDTTLTYRYQFSSANQLTQVLSPFATETRASQLSGYVQDRWTVGRLTLEGAIRFDQARSSSPRQQIGPMRTLPAALVFDEASGVDVYTDVTPRLGAAFDLLGDGRTVVRVTAAKYLDGISTTGIYAALNPANTIVRSTSRQWFDLDGDGVADCNLASPNGNGECGSNGSQFYGRSFVVVDDALRGGSGVRPSDWNASVSVERQIGREAAVSVGYARRWFDGFTVQHTQYNPLTTQQLRFNMTVPSYQGGYGGITVGPYYLFSSTTSGSFREALVEPADRYGSQTQSLDTVDAALTGRLPFGLRVAAGISGTVERADSCEIREALPLSASYDPFCDVSSGWLTQVRGLATYRIPRLDVQLGAIYQNRPGPMISALQDYLIFFFGTIIQIPVNVVEPGTAYGDRISSLDLRATKNIRFGRSEVAVGVDVYNVLNAATPLTYSSRATSYDTGHPYNVFPSSIQSPRLFRITGEFRF
jgi:hypothetical protein